MAFVTPGANLSPQERKSLLRSARQRGVVIQAEALPILTEIYATLFAPDFAQFLEGLFQAFYTQKFDSSVLTEERSRKLRDALNRERVLDDEILKYKLVVIDVFDAPVPVFNGNTKLYGTTEPSNLRAAGPPNSSSARFRNRFEMVQQRVQRDQRFHASTVDVSGSKLHLTEIEALRGRRGSRTVLGYLSQLEEGAWFLEDLRDSIELDVTNATLTPGIHTDGSIVLVQGEMTDAKFRVDVLGSPSAEERATAFSSVSDGSSIFGPRIDEREFKLLEELERKDDEAALLFFADFRLDKQVVIDGFRAVLGGFQEKEVTPTAVVLMGNFWSEDKFSPSQFKAMLSKIELLAGTIAAHPAIAEHTHFIFVPGPQDAGVSGVLPTPALPEYLFRECSGRVKNVHLVSNPCRLRFCTQEIVIMREDLMRKMVKHSIAPIKREDDHSEHLVKSLLDQGYLCPLPKFSCPVLWEFDHGLWLFPAPHALILGDCAQPYVWSYNGCETANPGSFADNCTFTVYKPKSKQMLQSGWRA